MGKRLKTTQNSELSPFRHDFGEKIGAGQDNYVRAFRAPEAGGLVVKISKQKGEDLRSSEQEWRSTLYKKKKYEILKMFLGDFVPDSSFVLGHKTEGRRDPVAVPKSYTIQERVPQVQIGELSADQQRDPRLLRQLYILMRKLKNMYDVIDEVNYITGNDTLDGKLDMGNISKYVRNEYEPGHFDPSQAISNLRNSPNLLIDPASMQLYCIDFDDGEWDDEKEAAKAVLTHIVDTQPEVQGVIQLDPKTIVPPAFARPAINIHERHIA